jgi:hypothetical protein
VSTRITYEEWLAALKQIRKPSKDTMSATKWKARLGFSWFRTSAWIHNGLSHGWLERAPTTTETVSGVERRIVGFRLVTKAR